MDLLKVNDLTTCINFMAVQELQKIKEYGPIIPNNISLLYKNCKGCKPMYNMLIEKKVDISSHENHTVLSPKYDVEKIDLRY